MTAFYLKYRPASLDDIIGQEIVKKTLQSAITANKLSHAYLFAGSRGTGKTSTARILAKMITCEKLSENYSPCNKCTSCLSIADGSFLDLIEIDAASNRGIDDIRSLRDTVKLAPSFGKKKIYLIDEVHMLTTEAFNALLKTLEEPPAHVLFILATTEPQKIPQTILSRVTRLDFKLATQAELLQALQKVVASEKLEIEDPALATIARRAEGSFRDAVKLLDQLSSQGTKITTEDAQSNLRLVKFDEIILLIKCFMDLNSKAALLNISQQLEKGVSSKDLILSLMEIMRAMLLIKKDLKLLVKDAWDLDQYDLLVETTANFSDQQLTSALNILQKCTEYLKFTLIPQLPLEMAVMEICGEEMNKKLDVRSEKIDEEVRSSKLVADPISSLQPQDLSSNIQHPSSNPDISKLQEKWLFVLETVRPFNYSLEALLKKVKIANVVQNEVILEVPYSFHQRILEAPKSRDLLEGVLSDILGRSLKISCILGKREIMAGELNNIELAQDDEIIRAAAEIFNSETVN